jgi:hypothetical protein
MLATELAPTTTPHPQTASDTHTPLMSWSQTPSCITIVVSLRTSNAIQPTITFTAEALELHVVVDGESRRYTVDARWFASVETDKCAWKRQGNGDLLLSVHKTTEEEWPHPFADRAYKGFVRIDWSRWVDADDSDAGEDGGEYDFDALSSASPRDFGGQDEASFPSESNTEFQNMMKGLEKLGNDKDVQIPDMEALRSMNTDQLKEMLTATPTGDDGCSELDLDKVADSVDTATNDNCSSVTDAE